MEVPMQALHLSKPKRFLLNSQDFSWGKGDGSEVQSATIRYNVQAFNHIPAITVLLSLISQHHNDTPAHEPPGVREVNSKPPEHISILNNEEPTHVCGSKLICITSPHVCTKPLTWRKHMENKDNPGCHGDTSSCIQPNFKAIHAKAGHPISFSSYGG